MVPGGKGVSPVIRDLFAGSSDFIAGLLMLFEPGMRRYALGPLLLSILAFAIMLVLGIHYFSDVVHWITYHLPGWLKWSIWLIWIAAVLAFLYGYYFAFTAIVAFVGLPFFIALSNEVERRVSHGRQPNSGNLLYQIASGTVRQFPRLAHLMLWWTISLASSFILGMIPVINAASWIPWFLFGAWSLAVMTSDFPLGTRNLSWRAQHQAIAQQKPRLFGFGITAALCTMIPLVNLLLLPAATAGITRLWARILSD